jgi:hypothetical protein
MWCCSCWEHCMELNHRWEHRVHAAAPGWCHEIGRLQQLVSVVLCSKDFKSAWRFSRHRTLVSGVAEVSTGFSHQAWSRDTVVSMYESLFVVTAP